jgi:hypothetical protein
MNPRSISDASRSVHIGASLNQNVHQRALKKRSRALSLYMQTPIQVPSNLDERVFEGLSDDASSCLRRPFFILPQKSKMQTIEEFRDFWADRI